MLVGPWDSCLRRGHGDWQMFLLMTVFSDLTLTFCHTEFRKHMATMENNMKILKELKIELPFSSVQLSSLTQSCSTLCQLHGPQHARLPCPSPTAGACSNSCSSNWWCHPTISFSVVPFPSCLQSFQAPGSSPRSQFFASGGQSIGASASASVLPMNIQDWFPLGLTDLICSNKCENKGKERLFAYRK